MYAYSSFECLSLTHVPYKQGKLPCYLLPRTSVKEAKAEDEMERHQGNWMKFAVYGVFLNFTNLKT